MRLLLCCLAALARPTRGLLPRLGARTRGATCAPPRAASAAPESSVSGPDSVDALREQLFVELDDGFPLFTHANADGAPLQYERADGGGKAFALLYSDIEHALAELAKNRREYPTLGLLIGLHVGSLWYWCLDQAIVQRVLSAKSIGHARGACRHPDLHDARVALPR